MQDNLPSPSIITELAEMADIICISCKDICGENEFRCLHLKEGRLWTGIAGGHQAEMSRYALDMEGFWSGDKSRIIAVSLKFS
jgi:hypothetical protein